MDFFNVILTRASVRAFKRVQVSDTELIKILDAGRRAPSGYNAQPWEFIIIRDRDILTKLGRIQGCISQVDVAIAVVVNESATKYWKEDAAAAIENMLLAAVASGYASLWIEGYVLMNESYGKEILRVPDNMRLLAILPLGKPLGQPIQGRKKPLGETTYLNNYGLPWKPKA
jgi:nitroreductase